MAGLTVVGVKNAKPGRHADGKGLYLLVAPGGSKSWVLRVQVDQRRRDVGLGSIDTLSLAEARERSAELRKAAKLGKDPIEERDKDRKQVPSFKEAAKACHADLKGGWSERGGKAFLTALEQYAFPKIGRIRVDQIEASHLRDMLAPIWLEKPETARKLRQRASTILNYAQSKGWRSAEAPGKSVTMGLARQTAGGNYAAMPYAEVPAFVAGVEAKTETMGRLALLFTIHTAARSGEARQATWDQVDLDRKLWTRPASVMKSRAAHVVTLTDSAISILERAQKHRLNTDPRALIFPSTKKTPLSDMTLSKVLRDAEVPFTVHGFRSSFRDFAAEQMPMIPDAVAEAALAHIVSDKVVRAYKRTDFLEMRRKLLDGWAHYLAGKSSVLGLTTS